MTARRCVVFASLVLLAALGSPAAAQDRIYRPGNGIRNPTLLKEVKPAYTPEAMRQRIEGVVILEVVVQKDGTVGDVRVMRSLDAATGLDNEAINAARQWRFKPSTLGGEPIDIYVTLELAFRLHDGPFGFGAHRQTEVGLIMPVVMSDVQPRYTPEALREKIEGTALVEVVVGVDGLVSDARLVKSVDEASGLNAEALRAARQWVFQPGTFNRQPVPVVTYLEMKFGMH